MMMYCVDCEKELPRELFYRDSKNYKKNPDRTREGYEECCKPCSKKRVAGKKYASRRSMHPDYPLTPTELSCGMVELEYQTMFVAQGGRCKICRKVSVKKLHVDHCHTTNNIRGLLCGSCNLALGLFKDSIQSLRRAGEYLCQPETGIPYLRGDKFALAERKKLILEDDPTD